MSYHIQFNLRALNEYENATTWYSQRSQKAADNFVLAMEEKLKILRAEPDRFGIKYKEYREISLSKYPYKIIYLIKEEERTVAIASIFHQKRNPKTKYRNLK